MRPFGGYDLIMADPPWTMEMRSEAGEAKSPQAHYETMSVAEIAAMPVEALAGRNCLLWMWAVAPMLPQALDVMAAWGFEFKTQGEWAKMTKHGKQAFGTGYILRGAGEPFLIGTRGAPVTTKAVRSVIIAKAREHSRKPDEAFAAAERLMPEAKRLELFSRQSRPGWDVWGNEVDKFAGAA
ncbi:MAG: DNA methyltransferase [Rhodobacteraceae bacterium]|nr:DNA methyltransferase [Paracoccaceae bacterium]